MAVGGSVTITTLPGYLPMRNDANLIDLYRPNAVGLVGEENLGSTGHRTGSTDMGDVSHLMPVIHPYVGGAVGTGHGDDYLIVDWENAVLTAAKAMAFTVVDLLSEGGRRGRRWCRSTALSCRRRSTWRCCGGWTGWRGTRGRGRESEVRLRKNDEKGAPLRALLPTALGCGDGRGAICKLANVVRNA